tara:strand:+ start:924 stop:2087 length:1164 start_codon:yes stop_codon:yes gene_type:complete
MNIPKEIDLYDWKDYAFYRAILGKPIPSPRVWDNAGRFGFKGGGYMKDIYFEKDFFEPTLYTKKNITNYINEKYGNGLRIKKGRGKLMKADKSSHKFNWEKDNNHLYLRFEDYLKVEAFPSNFDREKICEAIKEIYLLLDQKKFNLDAGFNASWFDKNALPPNKDSQKKWHTLNVKLNKKVSSKEAPLECLYEYIYEIFDCPSKTLFELNKKLDYEYWFVDMFIYSFWPVNYEWLRQLSFRSEEDEDDINKTKYLTVKDENFKDNKSFEELRKEIPLTESKREKDSNSIFTKKQTDDKNKSFPPWLPLITIPLIFIVSRSINSSRSIPPQRIAPPTQQKGSNVLKETCSMCQLSGDCSAFPFCAKSQKKCTWSKNWSGEWIEECTNF